MNHLCLVLVAIVLLAACGDSRAASTAEHSAAAPSMVVELSELGMQNAGIVTARASSRTFAPRMRATASIAADPQHLAQVGSRVPGRVVALPVRLGDRVQAGAPLVSIDAVELHQVSQEYLIAVARARETADALARQRQLNTERIGAVVDLRRAEADAEVAAATLREADEHLHFLGLSEGDIRRVRTPSTHGAAHSVVRAPIAGRVAMMNVALGQVLTGSENILTIADLDRVWAVVRLYERDLSRVAVGSAVDVSVPASPGRVFSGSVTFVGDIVDPLTRTVEARVELANPDGALRPGMSASASIALATTANALWLPAEAVQTIDEQRVVFMRRGPRRFEAVPVEVGAESNGYLPVIRGVREGDDVVTHGAFTLHGELFRAELETGV